MKISKGSSLKELRIDIQNADTQQPAITSRIHCPKTDVIQKNALSDVFNILSLVFMSKKLEISDEQMILIKSHWTYSSGVRQL